MVNFILFVYSMLHIKEANNKRIINYTFFFLFGRLFLVMLSILFYLDIFAASNDRESVRKEQGHPRESLSNMLLFH